ncbi:hypothetical protein PbB2_00208 [Candidatus Phycosocius bacilliformis]|uniref:DUF2125 domain-containing protein n=1 Tax=Candidatus Phycosocius bacilliformis TaxID=1445552 RepID=A0A2P2E659_9PROT|nr:DUF2125 domain-containing protein [Candidatus Phycosocius bacilliformis]GBF56551.1 hypothetical protein PbB2_00208 [Candidatus Phycosocius bacilliformis]
MTETKTGSIRGLILPLGFGALVFGGYVTYWNLIAQRLQAELSRALPQTEPGKIEINGFPYRVEVRLADFAATSANGFGFAASSLVMAASPFNLNLWALEGALKPRLTLPGGPQRPLTAGDLKASLRLKEGQLARLSITFNRLEAGPANAADTSGWQTGVGAFHLVADPKDITRLALALDVRDLILAGTPEGPAAILGPKIHHVRLTGPISQGQTLLRSARDWSAAGGAFTIMAGELAWGPLSFSKGQGSLKVSADGYWQGSIRGEGALKPEGVAVAGLSAPLDIALENGQARVLGLTAARLPKAFD